MAILAKLCDGTRPAAARLALAATFALAALSAASSEELFVSKRLTPVQEYTSHIEGPAVNAAGDLFVANIKGPGGGDDGGAIGRIRSGATTSEFFAPLPAREGVQSIGNGIRFDLE